jgi:hypothetical protein
MAYEVFKRTAVRVEQPSLSLVPDGRIAFNAAAVRVLTGAGVKSVLLLWDKTSRKVALKAAAKGEKDCYAVSIVKGTYSGSLRAKSFLSHIGWSAPKRTMLPATWNEKEKMFAITLPREHMSSVTSPDAKRTLKAAL